MVSADLALAHASPDRERQFYSRPPLVEVVLDIGVTPADDFAAERLDELTEAICEANADDQVSAPVPASAFVSDRSAVRLPDGRAPYAFVDPDRKFAVRATHARFGVSKQHSQDAPYERFEVVRDETAKLWNLYVASTKPQVVKRLSLRYVNRLDFPREPSIQLESYLRVVPRLSEGLAPMLSGYTLELKMPQPDMPSTLVVMRQATVSPPEGQFGSILLDIEVVRGVKLSPSSHDVWNAFQELHDRANFTFESTITDKLRALIR